MKQTLGIDSSTQGVKAVAWDVMAQKVAFSASVNYGRDLPQYNSPDGFLLVVVACYVYFWNWLG